ncbi:DUF4328 domain-containing protein [Streptomyces sp. NPDC005407]|uniref:DUF4328 domain-containing protein n=1 Tax=Streptomyces sp. NPDC005407 TaxID=3155340 RepID=UPI0033A99411
MALCAITFLAWLLRVRDNARALSGQPPRYAWPWIYAGWIVPVAHRKRPGRPSGNLITGFCVVSGTSCSWLRGEDVSEADG